MKRQPKESKLAAVSIKGRGGTIVISGDMSYTLVNGELIETKRTAGYEADVKNTMMQIADEIVSGNRNGEYLIRYFPRE